MLHLIRFSNINQDFDIQQCKEAIKTLFEKISRNAMFFKSITLDVKFHWNRAITEHDREILVELRKEFPRIGLILKLQTSECDLNIINELKPNFLMIRDGCQSIDSAIELYKQLSEQGIYTIIQLNPNGAQEETEEAIKKIKEANILDWRITPVDTSDKAIDNIAETLKKSKIKPTNGFADSEEKEYNYYINSDGTYTGWFSIFQDGKQITPPNAIKQKIATIHPLSKRDDEETDESYNAFYTAMQKLKEKLQ